MLIKIKELSDHMFWADGIVWDAVMKLPENENLIKLKELFYHTHSVQNAYLNIWLIKPLKLKDIKEFQTLNKVAEWGLDFHKKLKKYLNDLNKNDLDLIIKIPWTESLEEYLGKPAEPSSLSQQLSRLLCTQHIIGGR